jgi:tRNA threonylcarbamoyladenosine biosynthesis protein TsaE
MHTTLSHSESETLALAAAFAAGLNAGDAVALRGPLGAGKTLFARGVARALGFEGPVSSPSYALVHEYAGRVPVYHMDLYRLKEMGPGADWEEVGLSHYFDPPTSSGGLGRGICLVEWPERLPPGWSPFTHEVTLEIVGEMERIVRMLPL